MPKNVKKEIARTLTKWIVQAAIKRWSFLSWGPLPMLLSWIIGPFFRTAIIKGIESGIALYIDYRVDGEVESVHEVTARLRKELRKGEPDRAKIKEMDKELTDAAFKLIRITRR